MNLRVSADHIVRGERCDPECCPTAYAVREHYPDDAHVRVYPSLIIVSPHGEQTLPKEEYNIDLTGQRFITQFDAGRKVRPCTFTAHPTAHPV